MEALSIAEARMQLPRLVAQLRGKPDQEPIMMGSHRKREAVLLSVQGYEQLGQDSGVSIQRLRQLKPLIRRLAQLSNLDSIYIYGSVVRGEQTEASDVDLLVTPLAAATLFDIAQFELDMELLLDAPVSATSINALDTKKDARILAEAVPL